MNKTGSLFSDVFLISLVALLIGAFIQLKPVDDSDIYTQVKLGELHWAGLELIEREPFSYLNSGKEIRHPGWLAQVLYFSLYDLGGWRLCRLVHCVFFGAAFLLIGLWSRRLTACQLSDFSQAFALFLGALVGMSNASLRPQGIALVCFALTAFLAESRSSLALKLVSFLAIGLIWQNCHPSLSLGILVMGVYLASALWRWLRDRGDVGPIISFSCLTILGIGLLVATPSGTGIFELSARNLTLARDVLGVSEWLPPYSATVAGAMAGFWAMTGLCLLASYPSGKKVDHRIEAIALSGLFFLASLMACRFALFWGLISIPVFAALIESVKSQKIWNWKQIDLNKNKQAGLLCFLAFVCVLVLTIVGFLSPVENRTFPTRCIQDLRQNLGISRVYNYREWGGIITFAGSDHWQIGLDGRLYLYSEDDFQNYAKEALGLVSVDAIEERHQPDAFFLRRDFHSALIDLLISDASWDVSCKDGLGVVFTRSRD